MRLHVDLRVVGQVALLPSGDPQADVIFVRHGFRSAVPDDVEEVVGLRADELRALRAVVVADGAAELLELAVVFLVDREQRHRLGALELALHARDVRPHQAFVVVQRHLGFAVHDDAPSRGFLQQDPALAPDERLRHGEEQRSVRGALHHHRRELLDAVRVHHHGVAPGRRRQPRGGDFRRHAPGAEVRPGAGAGVHIQVLDVLHERDDRGVRVAVGVARVQPVDVRQQKKVIRVGERRDVRRERVVVPELHVLHRDGVVLVDDGDDVFREQRLERALRVEVLRAVHQVVQRDQNLRDGLRDRREEVVVHAHEPHHAHRRHGLLAGQIIGLLLFSRQKRDS